MIRGVLIATVVACALQPAVTPQPAAALIETTITTDGLAAGRALMDKINRSPEQYAVSERDINALGYRYLARKAYAEAIAVFEFNVRRFPASSNVYDSLAEGCLIADDMPRFESTVADWAAKFPGDPEVAKSIAKSRAQAERRTAEMRNAYTAGQTTGVQGPYFGQAPPGTTPKLFAPGIVSMALSPEFALTMSPDGKEFYFTRSDMPRQFLMVSRLGPGGWTFPELFTLAAGYTSRESHVTLDNKRIYWEWLRPVPAGETDVAKMDAGIWMSERTANGWSEPKFVGQGMFVTSTRTGDIYITDHTEFRQGNAYLAKARVADGKFVGYDRLQGGMEKLRSEKVTRIAHPGVAPDGSYILFDAGRPPVYVCFHNADGTWGDPIDLSQHGMPPAAGIASVSPDGKYIFFGMNADIYWVSSQIVEQLRPAVKGTR